MKKTSLLTVLFLMAHAARLFAQAGNLDLSFDNDGIVTTGIGTHDDIAQSVVVQPDGKIILGGYSFNGTDADFGLVRFNNDGTLDNTFNSGGAVTTPIGSSDDYINSLALQDDGKIIAAGYSYNGSNFDFAVARYNSDGSLDTDFDVDGKLTTDFNSGIDRIYSVAIQDDGKIVVAGSSHGVQSEFALARYNTDGTPDNTFDTDGKLTTTIGTADEAYSVAIQTDGKIVVSGWAIISAVGHITVARYNPDGTLDNTFDADGTVSTVISANFDYGESVAIQTDGKIVVGGYSLGLSDADFAVVRYNSDGSPDNSFSTDGIVITNMGSSNDQAYSLKIQTDGKILLGGWSFHSNTIDFALARYNTDGTLDNTFSGDGKLTTPIGASDDVAFSIALQSDGKIIAAGYSFNGTNYDFAAARYLSGLVLGVIDAGKAVNTEFIYPNPIGQNATLDYKLITAQTISICLLDVQGRVLKTYIENETQQTGEHKVSITLPDDLTNGPYLFQISDSDGRCTSIRVIK